MPGYCPQEIINETDTIDLVDYPPSTECFYTLSTLLNFRNTQPVHVKHEFIKERTAESLFVYEYDIPIPETYGYRTYPCFGTYAYIGHFPHEINEPGSYLCEISYYEGAVYKGKILVQLLVIDSSLEPEPSACPDFWVDPIGAVLCWIINGLESMLGWEAGTLTTKLGQIWDVITNFGGAIADFFSDAIGSVVDWVRDHAGEIFDWLGDNFSKFIGFLNQVGGDIAGFVIDAVGGAWDFITDKAADFFDWLGELTGSVADYISGAIGDFVDWTSDQLGGIWDGIQTFFLDAISGFVEAFFGGLNTGIEEAKHSPLHSDEPVRNPVLKGLMKVVREHRKKYGRDEITGER